MSLFHTRSLWSLLLYFISSWPLGLPTHLNLTAGFGVAVSSGTEWSALMHSGRLVHSSLQSLLWPPLQKKKQEPHHKESLLLCLQTAVLGSCWQTSLCWQTGGGRTDGGGGGAAADLLHSLTVGQMLLPYCCTLVDQSLKKSEDSFCYFKQTFQTELFKREVQTYIVLFHVILDRCLFYDINICIITVK